MTDDRLPVEDGLGQDRREEERERRRNGEREVCEEYEGGRELEWLEELEL